MRAVNCRKIYSKTKAELRAYFKKTGFKRAVLGMSGGLDSAITAKIAADALGRKNVFAIMMPEKGLTKGSNTKDAAEFAKSLGIHHEVQPINGAMNHFNKLKWKQGFWAEVNLKPRIRMLFLYSYANTKNALVVGTSNRSELLLGYGTKHGDLACDVMPLGNLYKTELFEFAKFLKIPEKIIRKEPTAELMPNQTDASELGAKYYELDPILKDSCDKKKSVSYLKKRYNPKLVEKIIKRVKENSHKGKFPYICKI